MAEQIYVVERHDNDYDGSPVREYARSEDTALDLAAEARGEHRGENWRLPKSHDNRGTVTWAPTDASGWVRVREAVLRE